MTQILAQLDYIKSKLAFALAYGELSQSALIFENLEDKILHAIRPSFVLQEQHVKKLGWKYLAQLDMAYFVNLEKEKLQGFYDEQVLFEHVFYSEFYVSDIAQQKVGLHYDYDDYRDGCVFALDKATMGETWEILLQLPPPYLVFGFDENYSDVLDWQWEYITAYEIFVSAIMQDIWRHVYIQVGGYAQYIQFGHDKDYVAQVNCEIGDAGSLYLLTDMTKFQSTVQMY